ncbi:K1C19 protein, partial [Leiothrix lutea]|nr:K1C19 protein [Leiothrix lutea]
PSPPSDPFFPSQITETTLEVTQSTKDLDTARGTVGALRRSLQTLEIDLEALRNQNAGLEAALAEAEARAGAHLAQVQLQVSAAEAELRDVRAQLQRQNEEHRELLGLKDRLEAEIATYRQLLEGGDGGFRWAGGTGERIRCGAVGGG